MTPLNRSHWERYITWLRDRIGHGELDEDEEGSPIYKDGVKEHYFSLCPRLVELVDRCLNYDPAHRPSAQQLWQDIRQQVGIFRSNELLPLKLTEIPGNQAQPLVGGEGLMGFASDRGDSGGPDDGEEDDDEQDDDEQNDNGQNVNEGTSEEENDDDDEDLYGE
ncbi:hypothetical protein PRZ48_004455 [Zasmidium cellare]|uniref:Serine-threonine/tyrosine-protein kinase catalytic domain-containing protein n=1 Tax=Zasmidium cellare TaxID=395010 RepID=A0ABR0EPV3_ZASCE|nr:hypothetical protein PRZ48_004455 [Zasmidium cellare]